MNLTRILFAGLGILAFSVPAAEETDIYLDGIRLDDIRRDATVQAVEQVMPSVVNIATRSIVRVRDPFEEMYRRFYGQQTTQELRSLGSGVVIDEAGYLLTNDHVVRRADQIGVKFNTGTNVYEATVVASDPKRDIALLKLVAPPGEKFHAIKLAREDDLLLGETVLALGNPFGLGGSVTRGILSSKTRIMPKEGAQLQIQNWLQTDAPINPGNSGGPLVNLRGELIGINVAVLNEYEGQPAQGIGFAIPIRLVEEALSEILPTEYVKSYWFGARVKVGTTPLVIANVQPESPAGRSGLKPGDTILSVSGKRPKSFIDFSELIATNASSVSVTVQRGTNQLNLPVQLVPEKSIFNSDMVREKLGLSLDELTPEVAGRYGVNTSDAFVITNVQEKSPAAAVGLQSGMLVTAIDGQAPTDVTSLAKQLYAKKKDDRVRLDIAMLQRAGNFNVLRQGAVELAVR
jgi:S1-C subfamily serine protease